MRTTRIPRAFTLIELLTVIAIIAVLAALLFPILGSVGRRNREVQCMTQLHQMQLAASMYFQDEGVYPAALLGTAEAGTAGTGGCDPATSTGQPLLDTAGCAANATAVIRGYLVRDQVKDPAMFHCPEDVGAALNAVAVAYYPLKPAAWPAGKAYVTDASADANAPANVCPKDANGLVDCWLSGPNRGQPKLYYVWDSYDIGPRINTDGTVFQSGGSRIFERHYSLDWTGNTGSSDLPNQLKYNNAPSDKTLVAFCTWHTATGGSSAFPAVTLGGSARKVDLKSFLQYGPNYFNR